MAYQARDQHVQNYKDIKKKNHRSSMKALLDSPEKKVFSCDIGPLHYNGVRDGVYRMTRYLKKKASSSFF